MWSSRKQQVKAATETVARAVRSAGGMVVAALVIACGALAVALAALILTVKMRPASAS
jgi:hypothetical protein